MRKLLLTTTAVAALLLGGEGIAQDRVGVTAAVNQDAEIERSAGRRTVVIGENVLFDDRVITSREALVQILFVDGSAFTIGSNARVVIDEFVFNPATGSGDLVAEVTEGALRFVGGRLSKSGGQVRFRTPVGTLGVRGAIATIDLAPPCTGGVCPIATVSLVFGSEITLTLPNGGTRRVYQPGYSLVFTGNPNSPAVEIVPTATLDQSSLQARLSGRPGRTGGAAVIPTDADVVESGLPLINSARSPRFVLPRPRPRVVRTAFTPDDDEVGIGSVTNTITQTIINQATADLINNAVDGNGPPPPPPPVDAAPMGVFVTPDAYELVGVVVDDPGAVDITLDATGLFDVGVLLDGDGDPVQVRGEDDTIRVPTRLGRTPIRRFFSETVQEFALGSVYRGEENFLFYYFQRDRPDAAQTQVAYLVYGEPTDRSVILPTTVRPQEIRSYELLGDEQKRARGIATQLALLNPLVAEAFGVGSLSRAAETPFFIVDRAENQSRLALTGYAGLLIDGAGEDQKSAVNLALGAYERAGTEGATLNGNRPGSYRVDASLPAGVLRGSVDGVNPLDGPSPLFGSNGQNLVLSSGVGRDDPFFDEQPPGGFLAPDEVFSSAMIVANLVDQQLASERDRPRSFLAGFAAGMVETRRGAPESFRSETVGDVVLRFDPLASRVGGVIDVRDVGDAEPVVDALSLPFGSAARDDPTFSRARSVYIDSDNYFARAAGVDGSRASPTTTVTFDDGAVVSNRSDRLPGTYLVGSETVPQPRLFADAGVTPCACDFMEWGWWGTFTDVEGDDVPGGRERNTVHLGTWAAGDITRSFELPRTGTASYDGHAVGNVVNGSAQYVAVGDLAVDYDFGARTGELTISNFDGRSVSGDVAGVQARQNQFGGALSGSGLSGSASGSFVTGPRGPAQGVLGAFDMRGERYKAVGTFVGEQGTGRRR